jgi:hypothetical protein
MGTRKGNKPNGIAWGTLAAIATIVGAAYALWHSQQEDEGKRSAAAARVHHSRIRLGVAVPASGATLLSSNGMFTIDPAPPPLEMQRVTVKMNGSTCPPSAMLDVTVNEARLQLARCSIPRGATGDLTWIDDE